MTVDVGWFQKCSVSGCSKAERKGAGFTFTNGLCVPIVLCAPLASTDLVVERKWHTPQAERKSGVTMCETVDAPLSFLLERFGFSVSENLKGENIEIPADTNNKGTITI